MDQKVDDLDYISQFTIAFDCLSIDQCIEFFGWHATIRSVLIGVGPIVFTVTPKSANSRARIWPSELMAALEAV